MSNAEGIEASLMATPPQGSAMRATIGPRTAAVTAVDDWRPPHGKASAASAPTEETQR